MPTWIAKAFSIAAIAVSLLLVADAVGGLSWPTPDRTAIAAQNGR